jgi:ABC-type transport system involved in cytochrome c biogenesis permease subunit
MQTQNRLRTVLTELRNHAPFTLFGALTGIIMMLLFKNVSQQTSYRLFYIFHPAHVVLSAMVTASLFSIYEKKKSFLTILMIGYIGSIGTATLSDSIIPFYGESILGVAIPTEAEVHSRNPKEQTIAAEQHYEQKGPKIHLGFIEEWYIVNPAAILGILIACFLPRTKFPHAGHILISTWASAAHVMMNIQGSVTILTVIGIFIVLFIAVWLPCCFSDIVFPLLFIKSDAIPTCICHCQ